MSDTGTGSRPIIVVAAPPATVFQPRGGGTRRTLRPTRERQGERLDGRFKQLERLITGAAQARVSDMLPDSDPELVVVLEVVDTTNDLDIALRGVGMEPL